MRIHKQHIKYANIFDIDKTLTLTNYFDCEKNDKRRDVHTLGRKLTREC
jgi:hypothetical protein